MTWRKMNHAKVFPSEFEGVSECAEFPAVLDTRIAGSKESHCDTGFGAFMDFPLAPTPFSVSANDPL
jgi:hypothetical protein